MKPSKSFIFILVTALLLQFCSQKSSPVDVSRKTLESAFELFLKACRSGEESALKQSLCVFRYVSIKNNLANMKRSLTPEIIQEMPTDYPEISNLTFLKVLSKGPTAALLYARESEERDASNKPRIEFIFLRFVREESVWKFDKGMLIEDVKYQEDGSLTEFDETDLQRELAIDGKISRTPELISIAEIIGFLDVDSYGYKTTVTMNKAQRMMIEDGSKSSVIRGGVQSGNNSIEIVIEKIEKGSPTKPRITVSIKTGSGTVKEVFTFAPENNIEGKHQFTFTVDE